MPNQTEHSAWQDCYRELAPKLLLYARQWAPSVADAEDVVQTAFVRFWKKNPSASREHYPLLYTAVRTAALDLIRREERRATRENHPDSGMPLEGRVFAESQPEDDGLAPLAAAKLQELPVEQREVIVLKLWGDLTFQQIAETTGAPLNTVAARYRYGLAKLRAEFETHQSTP